MLPAPRNGDIVVRALFSGISRGTESLVFRGRVPPSDFVAQFDQALGNVLAVLHAAGGVPSDLGRFTIYVTDMAQYRSSLKALGESYRRRMGSHYPAMALVEVKSLVDPHAVVEIEATAVLG